MAGFKDQYSGFWIQGSKVLGSAQRLAAEVASLIKKETFSTLVLRYRY
jgi:hypothetical protein